MLSIVYMVDNENIVYREIYTLLFSLKLIIENSNISFMRIKPIDWLI